MDVVIKIFNVNNKTKEINEIIDKISKIPQLNEIGANISTETITREFIEIKDNEK